MPQVRIIAKNFMDMVASLPAMKLDRLYQNAFICEAILRSLPPLAKKYVVQILFFDGPVSGKLLEQWVLADGVTKHRVAIDRLIQLRIFIEVSDKKRESSYKLNQTFQANLRKHLTNGGVLPRETMAAVVKLPNLEELDTYALEQWEVGTSSMDRDAPRLTEGGFQFLLMDTNAQLWYIIREYITNSEISGFLQLGIYSLSHIERGTDPADLISFLLELSFHVTGEAYNINTLTEIQRNTIKDLAELGLVKLQQGRKESWFIPTKLATNLSVSLTDSSSRKQGYVVVETNFRLYAYSSSKLHCEILRLFSKIEYQLPNLIVGAITKESLYTAFENGITSDQIISFLQQNAHPRVAERLPSVPENVTDQIRLWEADLNRVEITPSHFYDEFPSRDTFEAACDFAREWNGLLWEDSKKMRVVVKAEIHMNMREFLRGQK
ncbi:general transcription and DNA repair factor IIH subunit TFB2 [Populus alba x Populus x berolinensis]|uniref:RNA polymerase II transcription factor B subunit 2 n=1 Tax=Populus alba x Populus x berolinensis TaxID=444605 RepID=A0AAD6W5B4_9ROSI|nr:general transcription and DNA repair factor IIH subunit TFB2 [Populus alba x Populus x berolinensis]